MVSVIQTSDPADERWLALRAEFFPEDYPGEHEAFLLEMAAGATPFTAFLALDEQGKAVGFAEVAVRREYVNGCRYRPALFLEGIYVKPECRGRGVAHLLCQAAGEFGRQHSCREFASDVLLDDADSLAAHAALGFSETERVVYFRKSLISADHKKKES